MRILVSFVITSTITLAQFGKVEVTIDDRLLRSNERQKVSSIGYEITRFFSKSKNRPKKPEKSRSLF